MHTSGGRFRAQRDTCVANGHPSPNLSRNLSLRGGFLSSTESAGSIAQRDNRHLGGPTAVVTPLGPDHVNALLLGVKIARVNVYFMRVEPAPPGC
jgi:hypothetical protein